MGADIGGIMGNQFTDDEIWKQFDALKKLEKITRLKGLMAEQRKLPKGCGAAQSCAIVCYESEPAADGVSMIVRHTGDRGMRRAIADGRYKRGTLHKQCADCKKRELLDSEIRFLKDQLGYRY